MKKKAVIKASFQPVITVAESLTDPEVFKELLPESKDGRTLFHWATISGSLAMLKCLLVEGSANLRKTYPQLVGSIPNLNEPDHWGAIPLCTSGFSGILQSNTPNP